MRVRELTSVEGVRTTGGPGVTVQGTRVTTIEPVTEREHPVREVTEHTTVVSGVVKGQTSKEEEQTETRDPVTVAVVSTVEVTVEVAVEIVEEEKDTRTSSVVDRIFT